MTNTLHFAYSLWLVAYRLWLVAYRLWLVSAIATGLGLSVPILGEDAKSDRSTEALVSRIGPSIVTIRASDRDGEEHGLGTGFVVDASGLIATNFHVISEGRPLKVELWPSKVLKVLAVEASNRSDDLAILRVDRGDHELVPLQLSEETIVAQGVPVLAFGNPLGLRHSVVQGIVSAIREIEKKELIQVAIPIEPGNSGGPLVDMEGTVHGIINMKSAVAKNVGFAIPIARLKMLMQSTNPIAIDRWVRMLTIDPKHWKVLHGATWQERSGVINVTGQGNGFGGRALCLNHQSVPANEFEVAVDVKLADESGAAGLVFHSDGGDRHYGFYPSNHKLRLTCFKGPNVLNWEIIQDVASKHYVEGDWNRLKVQITGDRIRCFANNTLVIETTHSGLSKGEVGLAAFRGTEAEFRRFRVASELSDDQIDSSTRKLLDRLAQQKLEVDSLDQSAISKLARQPESASRELNRLADQLNRRASGLKRIAEDVQLRPILEQLTKWRETAESADLLIGSLWVAAIAHPELDIHRYVERVDQMGEEIRKSLPEDATDEQKMQAINRFMFDENGFHGGEDEFYHQANNQIDRVIDEREGMPITLCVVYMELGRRLGLSLEGIGLPGRFVVRYRSPDQKSQLIDVFEKAERLNETDVAMMVMMKLQRLATEEDMRTQSPIEIITRILQNLLGSAQRVRDTDAMLRYAEGFVALHPESEEYRLQRGLLRYQTDRLGVAVQDLDWLIEHPSEAIDLERIVQLRNQIEEELQERARLF
ncbi:MAG: tetratricopeptide repeat protein [Pirellulaceae bacterium]|nr:tetratricopeptide repeat protein [Pirellulaceae bacterium]